MLLLTQELPFERVQFFLKSRDIDCKALKEALNEYNEYCGDAIKELDHYGDPEGFIEACGYRDAVVGFIEALG